MPFVLGPNPILARHTPSPEPRSLLILYNSKAAFLSSLLATRNWEWVDPIRVEFFFPVPCTNHDPQLRIKYSSRFALRTARMQGIGQRGQKRAYLAHLAQPKADWGQTWPSLALSWAEQEAELGPAVGLKLGPKRSRWTPNWRNAHGSPSHVQSGELGTPTLGPTETQHEEHCFKRSVIDSKKTWK